MEEIWRDIPNYEGLYQASTLGRIRSYGRSGTKGKILSPSIDKGGYLRVILSKEGIHKCMLVHRLVALTFIPLVDGKTFINHINTIRTDNKVENLEWCTSKENSNNPLTIEHLSGENNPFYGKHHSEDVRKKISEAHIGMKYSAETNAKKGRPRLKDEKNPQSVKILQYTKDGNFIKEWPSMISVTRELGVNFGSISNCCKGIGKSAGGYVWRYKEKEVGN